MRLLACILLSALLAGCSASPAAPAAPTSLSPASASEAGDGALEPAAPAAPPFPRLIGIQFSKAHVGGCVPGGVYNSCPILHVQGSSPILFRVSENESQEALAAGKEWIVTATWSSQSPSAAKLALRVSTPKGPLVHVEGASPLEARLPADALKAGAEHSVSAHLPAPGAALDEEIELVLDLRGA